ncbi:MAG TPA: glycosyltransferase [Candidatus Limnocylindrales bacterium]|nr:glycosyltransferase [Candidatus Limnocylindrales bacterium]
MKRVPVPADVRSRAEARAAARRAKRWVEADRLRSEIEDAGWTVVDDGPRYRLAPAHPADVVDGERVRYGRSASVPSVLGQAAVGPASVVIVATTAPDDILRAIRSVRATSPDGTQIVVVADGPEVDLGGGRVEASLGNGDEIVLTSASLGYAAALNCGIRRARSSVVVVMDGSIELIGDALSPLIDALTDPAIAAAGPYGIRSQDLRQFDDAPAGDVDAIEGYLMAFRRQDYVSRGPLDEHFRFYRNLDIWWSLVLRDEGEQASSRRAVAIGGLPLIRHEHRAWSSLPEADRDRLSKRNFYRLLDRFRDRRDLLTGAGAG